MTWKLLFSLCGLLLCLLTFPATATTTTHADITVLPANVNKTIFEDGSFRRTCRYTGARDVSQIAILRDGHVVDEQSLTDSIMLDIASAELSDTGSYTCRVEFSDSTSITASLGYLTVIALSLIHAPPDQYVVEGEDIDLECTFDNPDQIYGTVIITIRRGEQITPTISGAGVEDEGDYRCDISLISHDDSTQVPITLHVFTAVNVTRYPDKYQELEGVQETTKFTVSFTGRQSQGVGVRWFKNGIELFNSAQYTISTSFFEETRTGNTSILFPDMDRGDSGVYRVLVSTDFAEEEIPLSQRRDEESFQIEILVPPPDPVSFMTLQVAEHQVELHWVLPVSHPNQNADSFQLQVSYPNGSIAHSDTLGGSARSALVNVFPGVTYEATLTASNNDGKGQASLTFSTPPAAPYVTFFEARRLNETHFNISISLLYTGGGDTTTFSVYFREQHTINWSPQPIMKVFIDSSLALEYHGVISGEQTRGKGPLEFGLRVENGLGFMNRSVSSFEISDLPGVFKTPVVAVTSDTSVILDIKLPDEGTPPFINIILEFSEPQVMTRNFTGTYHPGETVEKEVKDLSPRTAYSLKARAVNYAGDGPSSETINFTTNDAPPTTTPTPDDTTMGSLMMPIIYGAAGGGAVVVLFIVIPVSIFCCFYCRKSGSRKTEKHTRNKCSDDVESGPELEKEMKDQKSPPISLSLHHHHSTTTTLDTLEKPKHTNSGGNVYIPVPQLDRREAPPSMGSSISPSPHKWRGLERGHNQASSSTLNSGGSTTQDSFIKKPDVLSTDSAIQSSSLQSSQPSHQASRDSLGYYRRQKVVNPSISSGGSETTTETTERYQTTPLLMSSIGEAYSSSSQTVAFTPQDLSYTSLPYSDQTQTQYSMDHPPHSQCTDV